MIFDWMMFWAKVGVAGAVLCTVGAIIVVAIRAIKGDE